MSKVEGSSVNDEVSGNDAKMDEDKSSVEEDDSVTGISISDEFVSVGREVDFESEESSVRVKDSDRVASGIDTSMLDGYSVLEAGKIVGKVSVAIGRSEEDRPRLEEGMTGLTSVDEGMIGLTSVEDGCESNEVLGASNGKDQVKFPMVNVAGNTEELPVLGKDADSVHGVSLYALDVRISTVDL